MFSKLFGRPKASEAFLAAARRVAQRVTDLKGSAESEGRVTITASPLYSILIDGSLHILSEIVTMRPFSEQLLQSRFGPNEAALATYLQLVAQQIWLCHYAFESDGAVAATIGLSYLEFAREFVESTKIGSDMVISIMDSGQKKLEAQANDYRSVVSSQLFDLLQTMTEGRYTANDWRASNMSDRIVAINHVEAMRLGSFRIVKDKLGLDGPVLTLSAFR